MGSRGVGSYSYNRKVQLANKISTINKKLAKIEAQATKEAQTNIAKQIHNEKRWSSDAKMNLSDKRYDKGHIMQEKGAGKLQQQKKQYTKELAKLNAGQMRMFR
jgi:hypothetical protein